MNELKEQLEEYCKSFDVIVPRWQHELLAYVANKRRYIHMARGCGHSTIYFYEDLLRYLLLKK